MLALLLNRYSLRSANTPSDAIDTSLLNQIRALEQLTLNGSHHAPQILDAKVEHHLTSMRNWQPAHGEAEERKHFVTYILMTEVNGVCLKGGTFWNEARFGEEQRKNIRMAFRTALSSLYSSWVIFEKPDPKHIIWNPHTSTVSFVNFENAITFNNLGAMSDTCDEHISRTLPTRFQEWSNKWYEDWGLSNDKINAFSTGTDGTHFDDDGWNERYKSVVLQEPRMPEHDVKHRLVGVGGSGIEENAERKEYMVQLATFKNMGDKKCMVM